MVGEVDAHDPEHVVRDGDVRQVPKKLFLARKSHVTGTQVTSHWHASHTSRQSALS